jgi:hypothetical protein
MSRVNLPSHVSKGAVCVGIVLFLVVGVLAVALYQSSEPIVQRVEYASCLTLLENEDGSRVHHPTFYLTGDSQLAFNCYAHNNMTGKAYLTWVHTPNIQWNYHNETIKPSERLLLTFVVMNVSAPLEFVVYTIYEVV